PGRARKRDPNREGPQERPIWVDSGREPIWVDSGRPVSFLGSLSPASSPSSAVPPQTRSTLLLLQSPVLSLRWCGGGGGACGGVPLLTTRRSPGAAGRVFLSVSAILSAPPPRPSAPLGLPPPGSGVLLPPLLDEAAQHEVKTAQATLFHALESSENVNMNFTYVTIQDTEREQLVSGVDKDNRCKEQIFEVFLVKRAKLGGLSRSKLEDSQVCLPHCYPGGGSPPPVLTSAKCKHGQFAMDNGGQRENGRQKQEQYKQVHAQWMIPQHQVKDHHTMKLMAIMAERDNAIQERILALSEKKTALAERDMAILQRDAAIAERNNAIMERDSAIAALEYVRENEISRNDVPGCTAPRGSKHFDHPHYSYSNPPPQQPSNAPDNHSMVMHVSEAFPTSVHSENTAKTRHTKRTRKEPKDPSKKVPKAPRKPRSGGEDLNKVTVAKPRGKWKNQATGGGGSGEDLNKEVSAGKNDWKGQNGGLNQVNFDEVTMPAPVCSCTGTLQQCYKWGNGGWQSACCTTTLSMYPLPMVANKRHTRMGGRKMSGSAFSKLLSRLAAEGHDLSAPVDLKDHWAKHGTNRYITIR
ncbi:hypothetical protein Taro_045879, partial [Colocasia esculenta]|nr:hypothetical protein [Colocasia esculenta]